jgi:hypothetical protein
MCPRGTSWFHRLKLVKSWVCLDTFGTPRATQANDSADGVWRAAVAAPGDEVTDTETGTGSDGEESKTGTPFMQITTGVCPVLQSRLEQLRGVWPTEDPLDTGTM